MSKNPDIKLHKPCHNLRSGFDEDNIIDPQDFQDTRGCIMRPSLRQSVPARSTGLGPSSCSLCQAGGMPKAATVQALPAPLHQHYILQRFNHQFLRSNVCMSWTPPSVCAAPVRASSRCSPPYSRRQASSWLLAPRSWLPGMGSEGAARSSHSPRLSGSQGQSWPLHLAQQAAATPTHSQLPPSPTIQGRPGPFRTWKPWRTAWMRYGTLRRTLPLSRT